MVTILVLFGLLGLFAGTLCAALGNHDSPVSKFITAVALSVTLLVVVLTYLHLNLWAAGTMFGGFSFGANWGTAFVRQPS